jgi:hypothetical protein
MIFWILFMMIGTAVTGYMTLTDNDPILEAGWPDTRLFAFVLAVHRIDGGVRAVRHAETQPLTTDRPRGRAAIGASRDSLTQGGKRSKPSSSISVRCWRG